MKNKVLQSVYIPQEAKDFLTRHGMSSYPTKKGTTVASEIIVRWCLENGMKVKHGKTK